MPTYRPRSDQINECISRLIKHNALLSPYTAGLRLHIGKDFGLAVERGIVAIRWDFLIDPY